MPDQTQSMQEFNQQMDRMVMPFQRYGALVMNSFERVTRFQLSAAQTYSHFIMSQCRDAMEIRDQQSLREFFDKQSNAVRELSRKMAEDTETLASIGQEFASQAQRVAEQNVRTMTDMTQAMERAVEQDVRRATESGARRSA